jgi:ketosteroid isomerase-like protein
MTAQEVEAWVAGYERAWRTAGTDALRDLFTEDAGYRQSPYAQPVSGLPAIAAMWEDEREGPDEAFTMATEVVAVDGAIAVVRVHVRYGEPAGREYRDLWVMRFAPDGRCAEFEEWPFWPGQPHAAPLAP